MTLNDFFKRYVRENALVSPGEKVLLTVSGGVDSMVMLSLFAEAGYDVGVAHCNFQLRGQESDEDEVLVERQAARYGIPFYNMRFDTKGEMEFTGESVQMVARRLRYAWFDELCDTHGYDKIAIAHHVDDSIETFFINIFRGTGLRGLTGINVTNGRVIRPLLFASRKEILEYAHAMEIPFREDSSNRSTKYLRNKIRLGLIPRMREIDPRIGEQMSVNIQRLTEAQLFIDRCMDKIAAEVESRHEGMVTIDLERIADKELPANFIIFELLKKYGFKGDVIDALYKSLLAGSSGKRFYSKEWVAYTDRGRIIVSEIPDSDSREVSIPDGAGKAYFGDCMLRMEHMSVDDVPSLIQPDDTALIDEDKLQYPLSLRRWCDGDRFIPFGMTGHKMVSDFLIDEKVSMAEKARQFVLCSGTDIVWVVGRRIDDRYRIEKSTERVVRITIEHN